MNKKELRDFCKRYAEDQGYILQKNPDILNVILGGLLENTKKYGFKYCPCRVPKPYLKIDADIICPCKELRDNGKCICKLFLKK